ncbi:unnamed protein product [Durusdinium trenchii]|uniref:Glycosyltransferase 2-like domain-containing protein n=1 Tax=Durusdinium trenchii TaxID=1381693 RepID=A0ABP0S856_9DINO
MLRHQQPQPLCSAMGKKAKKEAAGQEVQESKMIHLPDITTKGMVFAALAVLLPPLLAMVFYPTPQANDDGFLPSLPNQLWQRTCPTKPSEIICVSDGNEEASIFEKELKAMHPKVQVIINKENKGLIVTKMEAAARAKGAVLMFLEPHVVVTPQWLEPLLQRLEQEPRALVMPSLDLLDKDMTTYQRMPFIYWRFEWNLNLIAYNPWRQEPTTSEPYPSPATSGGIYAIRKAQGCGLTSAEVL